MVCLTGNVGAGIRGQEDDRAREVFRDLDSAERDVFLELEEERAMVGVHQVSTAPGAMVFTRMFFGATS